MSITVSDEHLKEVENERDLYRAAFEAADDLMTDLRGHPSVYNKINLYSPMLLNGFLAAKKKLEGMK
jgi:hypothetical protein